MGEELRTCHLPNAIVFNSLNSLNSLNFLNFFNSRIYK